MAYTESVSTVAPEPKNRRYWFPAVVIVFAAIVIVGVNLGPFADIDRDVRVTLPAVTILAGLLALALWFFVLAGLTLKVRAVGAILMTATILTLIGSIRRVEFSGDMEPTLDFRSAPDRVAVLEAHRAEHRASGDMLEAAQANNAASLADIVIGPHDILEFRGPRRDGIIDGVRLARDWSRQPPKLVWRQPVGGGYASFVVAGPLAVTIEQRRQREAIVAYDLDDGSERWIHDYPALFSESLGGDGPRHPHHPSRSGLLARCDRRAGLSRTGQRPARLADQHFLGQRLGQPPVGDGWLSAAAG